MANGRVVFKVEEEENIRMQSFGSIKKALDWNCCCCCLTRYGYRTEDFDDRDGNEDRRRGTAMGWNLKYCMIMGFLSLDESFLLFKKSAFPELRLCYSYAIVCKGRGENARSLLLFLHKVE